MLKFQNVIELIKRAKLALEQYNNFEASYQSKNKGSIYITRKKYYYDKLTTYENNLKSYSNGRWVNWECNLQFVNIMGTTVEQKYNIILPLAMTKVEVEMIIPFKVDLNIFKDLVVLHIERKEIIDTGVLIIASEQ